MDIPCCCCRRCEREEGEEGESEEEDDDEEQEEEDGPATGVMTFGRKFAGWGGVDAACESSSPALFKTSFKAISKARREEHEAPVAVPMRADQDRPTSTWCEVAQL